MKRLLLGNLVAIQLIILTNAALAGLYAIDPCHVDLINFTVGSRISLPLIFGYRVLPSLFDNTALSYIIFSVLGSNIDFGFDFGIKLVDCLAPSVVLMAMHFFRLSSFFTAVKFIISHTLFLALITACITLSRFILIIDKAAYAADGVVTFFFSNLFGWCAHPLLCGDIDGVRRAKINEGE